MEPKSKQSTVYDLKPLYGRDSLLLLNNPDRGFRLEFNAYIGTGTSVAGYTDMKSVWTNAGLTDAFAIIDDEINWYASDHPVLAQMYLYLTKYTNVQELPQEAFDSMGAYFEKLKSCGIKAVVRFAYRPEGGNDYGDPVLQANNFAEAAPEIAIGHAFQLGPWLRKWEDQILVMQAGMIAPWGEWHLNIANDFNANSPDPIYAYDKNGNAIPCSGSNRGQRALLITWLENIPDYMFLQVRMDYFKYDNFQANETECYNRIGFHDDSIRGDKPTSYEVGGDDPNSEVYKKVRIESAHLLVEGEMYWQSANDGDKDGAGPGLDDAFYVSTFLKELHNTSFSIVHNYKERDKISVLYGGSMVAWQKQFVSSAVLAEKTLPFDPDWFIDSDGNPIERSMFEYVRDYLGYYLKIESFESFVDGLQATITLVLQNFGFSAPHGLKYINLVLLDDSNQVLDSQMAFVLDELQPLVPKAVSVTLVAPSAGIYYVALDIRSSMGNGARVANSITFDARGYNILGILTAV